MVLQVSLEEPWSRASAVRHPAPALQSASHRTCPGHIGDQAFLIPRAHLLGSGRTSTQTCFVLCCVWFFFSVIIVCRWKDMFSALPSYPCCPAQLVLIPPRFHYLPPAKVTRCPLERCGLCTAVGPACGVEQQAPGRKRDCGVLDFPCPPPASCSRVCVSGDRSFERETRFCCPPGVCLPIRIPFLATHTPAGLSAQGTCQVLERPLPPSLMWACAMCAPGPRE